VIVYYFFPANDELGYNYSLAELYVIPAFGTVGKGANPNKNIGCRP